MVSIFQKKKLGNSSRQGGFTIIETLVAISLVVITVTAGMWILSESVPTTTLTRNRLIATYLAQDAAEFVVAVKRQNTLDLIYQNRPPDERSWLRKLRECQFEGCIVDSRLGYDIPGENDKENVIQCSGECEPLQYNETDNVYGYGTGGDWEDTIFTRTVHVFPLAGDDVEAAKLEVTVNWTDDGEEHTVTTSAFLYNTAI